ALIKSSRTSLWHRLSQHRGVRSSGGGNHRGSIFRLHVGTALSSARPVLRCGSWAQGSTASGTVRRMEQTLEWAVSKAIGMMPFVWIAIGDAAGPKSERAYIERNSIALLSNWRKPLLDPPSANWLGRRCASQRVRGSGLWNSDHVDEDYDGRFVDRLEQAVQS